MEITKYQIELTDIHLFAHHGVLPQEKKTGADFTINIRLTLDDCSCAIDDNITSTVSYADIYDIIKQEMREPSKLLEHVCNRIMQALFREFTSISEIEISLYKDTPPMGGDRLKAGVTMHSKRREKPATQAG